MDQELKNLNRNIDYTASILSQTYRTLIQSLGKSYQRQISYQSIKVLGRIKAVTHAMFRYALHNFPYRQVDKLINGTKKTQIYFNCITEESFDKVNAAKRILNIQIEACDLNDSSEDK